MAREPRLSGPPLNPEEYGYVMGGPVRAAEVAIAALLERGVLRVNRDGELSATGQPHGLSRLETEVVETLRGGVLPVPRVIETVASGAAVRAIATAVRERGLGYRKRWFSRRAVPPTRSVVQERLTGAGLLPMAMMGTMPALIAMNGFGAYPDDDVANALLLGRTNAAVGAGSTCSYVWTDPGSGPAGVDHHMPWLGCNSSSGSTWTGCGGGSSGGSGGSSCGGGGSSCGGGGGGGCGGGGCGGGS